MKKFSYAVLAALVLSQPAIVYAAPAIDEAGAATLKAHVDEVVELQNRMAKATGEGFRTGGPTTVTPHSGYYEVRIPDTAIAGPGGKESMKIGTIVINAVPGDNGEYKVSLALPTPMTAYDAAGEEQLKINIGKQRFAGIWYPAFGTMTAMDSSYNDVVVTVLGDTPFALTIASLHSSMDLKDNGDGTWSGPFNFTMGNLKASVEEKGSHDVAIDSFGIKAHYDRIDLKKYNEAQKKLQALFSPENPQPDEAQLREAVRDMLSGTYSYFNGFTSNIEIGGLQVRSTPTDPQKEKFAFGLQRAGFGFDAKDLQQEKGGLGLRLHMSGLTLSPPPKEGAGLIPHDSNLDITVDNLPMQSLTKTFSGIISKAMDSALATQDVANAGQQAAQKSEIQAQLTASALAIPQMLAGAGSTLNIRNTYINAPDLRSTLEGQFVAHAGGPLPAKGVMTLVLTGVDELITKFSTSTNPKEAQMAQGMMMMQMMGQQTTGTDGKPQRTYKLELTPEGRMLLNGSDLSAMTGMPR